jgi:hypothetical protein
MSRVEAELRLGPDGVRRGTRWLLIAFAVLTLLAVNQLFLLADVADVYWAWTIHTEQTAAFVGAAYAAGFVLSVVSLRMTRWSDIRIPIVTVTAFTVLTAVATVVHAHRLNLTSGGAIAQLSAWVWSVVYLVVPVWCVVVVLRQERGRGPVDPVARPMPEWLLWALAGEGIVLFAVGTVLFLGGMTVHHHLATDVTSFWPWSLTPLSSMVIGAWLIAFGLAAAMAIREFDLSRLFVPGVTYTAFGVFEFVAVIWHWPQVSPRDPWLWAYLAVLAVIVGTGAYGWRAARRRPAGQPPSGRTTDSRTPSASR